MAEITVELEKWFIELQNIPEGVHLLCPQISDQDGENYKNLEDPESSITVDEKNERIENGKKRLEITYWNSLIFGFDKEVAGKWLGDFTRRLESCLKFCPECVLNWHMQRKAHLQMFRERWDEEVVNHIQGLLEDLDINRIAQNLTWAKDFIAKIEADGTVFKKSLFGEHLTEVHIAVYEALCCVSYLADSNHRAIFQSVFMRLQGKSYLKLGTKDPLPGMTYFLFDQKNDDRRLWAHENWKNIDRDYMTEEQFDWAVSGGLISAIDDIQKKDPSQHPAEFFLEAERFWQGFAVILRTLKNEVILGRLRSLELRPGCSHIYDLLFRHISTCMSEGLLVVLIDVTSDLLRKSPKAFWDVVGDARPNVIADLLINSPLYTNLLRQSLLACWSTANVNSTHTPFPTSWVQPWLESLSQDRRYDACDGLMHTFFESLMKNPVIGEAGQAACCRAGFDALTFTLRSFLTSEVQITTGNTHLYSSYTLGLVVKHMDRILMSMDTQPATGETEGWTVFKVAEAAKKLMLTALKLDVKLLLEERLAIHNQKNFQSAIIRDTKKLWEGILSMYDNSTDQIQLASDILLSLPPLLSVEQVRPRKNTQLQELGKNFNEALSGTAEVLTRLLGRVSELDTIDLNTLFSDPLVFQATTGLSVHENSDLAEASAEVLKSWTGELSRSGALEQMAQHHPEQTLASVVSTMDFVLNPPYPWGPIRPLLNMSRDVLKGLADPSVGVLRVRTLDSKSAAGVLRWWRDQWRFISKSCLNIEAWSLFIPNSIMTEFCREIMELAEALIAEDGLLSSATALGREEKDAMIRILNPAKEYFRGMENMIRLKDRWLVDVTVRVLCKILKRLRENNLEIHADSRKLIVDACIMDPELGRYARSTNLTDHQRAELLQALGQTEEEIQIYQLGAKAQTDRRDWRLGATKQSKIDAWSKSGSAPVAGVRSGGTNRDDVLDMSKSIDSPILKQLEARQAVKPKASALIVKPSRPKGPDPSAILAIKESRQREKAEKAKRDAEAIARARQLRGETVPGEGSSLQSLGLLGKDHSRSEIMVNSSDEESDADSDESDADNQLAALSTGDQPAIDEAERRRRQGLRDKLRRPVKKVRQQRSVKEMRARLIPPMDRLHNTILAWDLFHNGNDPPNGPAACEVATKYVDPRSYQETFFPLLASEAWRSFVTSKDEITAQAFGMKIVSRASVDSYLEVTFTMPAAQNKDRGVFEGDILLVSEAENPLTDQSARHCLARVHRITYKKDVVEITYRVASRANPLSIALTPGANIFGVKITNMATIEREYAALESLQYYDLMDEILKAEPSPIIRYGEEKVSNFMENWALNRGQALAVLGAQENDGFTLIQGPPGTGKTKTIIAMVGALLSEQLSQIPAAGTPVGVPVRPAGNVPNQARPKKLLVCAPSNAAVDELVLRLKKGITTVSGKHRNINVLRLGRSEAINAAVKDVTLDELVRVRLEGDSTKEKAKADRDKLHEDAANIKEQLSKLRPQLDESRKLNNQTLHSSLSRQFDDLKRQQMQIGKQIDANKDSGNSIAREMELRRRQVQQEILNSAQVLCATLSGSGHEMFRNLDVEFETVIIDEAAQCVELSALIPLKYGCCKCILVGDPKQLPPTVLSQSAARFGYDQSLFVRMQQNHPKSVHLLDMQYRMHPEISLFPSREFYESQLQDGQDMLQLRQAPWHKDVLFAPYRFFDVEGVQEKGRKGQSLVNNRELEVALQMYERFSRDYRSTDLTGKIGIITPYKAQLFELRRRFQARYGDGITDIIEFNTTDAFQGRECEIIIFSCVRASSTGGIGFMTDIRRMNVGLTRAKSSLWILGDSRALVQGEFWRKLIEDAQGRDRYTKGDILAMFRGPLEKAKADAYAASANKVIQGSAALARQMSDMDIVVRPAASSDGSVIPGLGTNATPLEVIVPRSNGPPVIHTSSDKPGNQEIKKRSLEGSENKQAGVKRLASEKARVGGGLMGKFGQKPPKPIKPPTDPSAMSLLGLAPPERPPPIINPTLPAGPKPSPMDGPSGPAGPAAGPSAATEGKQANANPPMMPRKKKKPNPFIKRR